MRTNELVLLIDASTCTFVSLDNLGTVFVNLKVTIVIMLHDNCLCNVYIVV